MTSGLFFAFWLGGFVGLFGSLVANWNKKPMTKVEREAFELWTKAHPGLTFGIVLVLIGCWPAFVLWLLAKKDDDELGPPAKG
jgi:hypothetical protein